MWMVPTGRDFVLAMVRAYLHYLFERGFPKL